MSLLPLPLLLPLLSRPVCHIRLPPVSLPKLRMRWDWDKGASSPGSQCQLDASCYIVATVVDGSAWLSMYVHLNCQLVC